MTAAQTVSKGKEGKEDEEEGGGGEGRGRGGGKEGRGNEGEEKIRNIMKMGAIDSRYE